VEQTQTLVDPKNDYAFKQIFGSIENKDVLIAFLQEILADTEKSPLVDLALVDPHLERTMGDDKLSVLDILAVTASGKQINVEMQVANEYDMAERAVYYLTKLHSKQMVKGQDYDALKKTISVNILDFSFLEHNLYHSYYHLREGRINHTLTEIIELHFAELPKLKANTRSSVKLERWLTFLKGVDPSQWEELSEGMPELKKAMSSLKYLSHDRSMRAIADQREKALLDHYSSLSRAEKKGIEKGMEKGLEQSKVEIAKNLLAMGLDIASITRGTGLNEEEIRQIQASEQPVAPIPK
jgi:predicted transposase/invertase (TIGR01784 family)